MLGYRMHTILQDIADITFPEDQIYKFFIKFDEKIVKGYHGRYNLKTKEIEIVNLNRPAGNILSTTIHELAHHVENSIFGDTNHQKRFYRIYKHLAETGIKMGVLTYDDFLNRDDSSDHKNIMKELDPNVIYEETFDIYKELKVIYIGSGNESFQYKDSLKHRGYNWDHINRAWGLIIDEENLLKEINIVTKVIPEQLISIEEFKNVSINSRLKSIMEKKNA